MNKNKLLTNRIMVCIIALFCCALWGSATPFIKIGYQLIRVGDSVASTILFAGARFFFAGIITVIIYSIGRRKFLVPKAENVPKVALVGLFQTVLQYILFYVGLSNTSGVKGTVLSGTGAFFSLLIASLIFKQEKLTFKKILGYYISFVPFYLFTITFTPASKLTFFANIS